MLIASSARVLAIPYLQALTAPAKPANQESREGSTVRDELAQGRAVAAAARSGIDRIA